MAETVVNTRAGTVKACRRARLAPPLRGQISPLPFKKADAVRAGQLLLELWNQDLQAQLTVAQRVRSDTGMLSGHLPAVAAGALMPT